MIMADVFTWLFAILGTLIVIVSYWLLSESLFSSFVERSSELYTAKPIRITLVGTLIAVPLVAIGLAAINGAANPIFKLMGASFALGVVLLGLLGSAGLARRVGSGLPSPSDETQPWTRVLRGGAVLALCFVLPFLGWFVLLPLTLTSGFGSFLFSVAGRRQKARPEEPNIEEAAA